MIELLLAITLPSANDNSSLFWVCITSLASRTYELIRFLQRASKGAFMVLAIL